MFDNDTPVDTDDTNLDDFSATFFGQDEAPPEPTKPEVDEATDNGIDAEQEDNTDVPEDDTSEDDETNSEEEDNSEDEEQDEEPAPQPKKSRFQERIDELTNARREAEREAQALRDRLKAVEDKLNTETPAPKPTDSVAEGPTPPKPTDTNEDGSEKYPLGEFDPAYITDLADFRVEQKLAERERVQEQNAQKAREQEARTQLEQSWNEELTTARERYPDFNEKAQALGEVFVNVPEAYGEYLGTTLMSMDRGADVLYYLANNPELAKEIVDSGAQRATIALGRIEAQFVEDSKPTPRKVSKAPIPPPVNKGSSAARTRVAPDTDDLDAFSAEFFKTK